jgi:hypothetical protein
MTFLYRPTTRRELEKLFSNPNVSHENTDTSLITNMNGLFRKTVLIIFSGLEKLNTSSVTDMSHMFESYSVCNRSPEKKEHVKGKRNDINVRKFICLQPGSEQLEH